ncbi:DMT family transporter [Vibrio viridaestus]|uniref:DMT family transporter n=1 Tax=Vibrio viridaestus TaxID=2487322 RepID=A0A3N9TJR1_9VIBR|nr:DMT family transporter [Vibrio viridaestus]RQW64411.1 DMT family transporter [Vibrio viridaestus]
MTGTFFIMVACFTWALDTLIRYPLLNQGYSTLEIVLYEHLTLIFLTAPLLWKYRSNFRHMNSMSVVSLFFIGGIGSAVGTLAFTQAFHYLNPTVVILLQKLQPIVAILGAAWFLKERIRAYFLYWSVLIIGGSLVMMWPDISALSLHNLHYSNNSTDTLSGYGYTLLAVFSWGMATVCGRYLSDQKMPANAIMSGRFAFGFLVLLTFSLFQPEQVHVVSYSVGGSIALMAVISGLLGMGFYYLGLKDTPAHMATLAEMTFPVFAAIINWSILGIELNSYQIIGGFILVLGNVGLRLRSISKPATSQLQQA